jgi:hypothetical protein
MAHDGRTKQEAGGGERTGTPGEWDSLVRFNLPEEEWPNKNTRVGCVQMATDDNPTLDPETIDFIFEDITDPDELDLRRYGVFKQISGRVHKTYSPEVCYIDFGRLFA